MHVRRDLGLATARGAWLALSGATLWPAIARRAWETRASDADRGNAQMKHKMELLQDVQATLESAIRIRQEIQVSILLLLPPTGTPAAYPAYPAYPAYSDRMSLLSVVR